MTEPSQMDKDERNRQYAAMNRAAKRSMNAGLINKLKMCSDGERFQLMKTFIANPDLSTVEVEERFKNFAEQSRTDLYTTVTLLQLKKEFGKGKSARAFIAELIKGFLPYIL
ncbi:unnamed protein product [Durusdinium trenchii]|uniref:Uncharacterized protein n=1 Tax=Durusdinium trenchii TaxID=1381693 RepID=A0ABP0PHA7_9DINO